MKYAVLKCVNGNYSVHAEGITDISHAKVIYHGLCQTLWDAQDVITGCVTLVDENFFLVESYKEIISHPVTAAE